MSRRPTFSAKIAIGCLLAFLGLVLASPVQARPILQVKARSGFSRLTVRPRGRVAKVQGQLRNNLNVGIPQARVKVWADGAPQVRVTTDGRGVFTADLAFESDGKRVVQFAFAGTTFLAPANGTLSVEVGRVSVRLRIDGPRQVNAGEATTYTVVASAGAADPLGGLQVESRLDGKTLPLGATDLKGRLRLDLGSLEPGAHRLQARFSGGPNFEPAQAQLDFEATLPIELSLRLATAEVSLDRPIVFRGVASGGEGVSVALTANGAPVDRQTVGTDGVFSFALDPRSLGPGKALFRATAYASVPGWQDGVSALIAVDIPEVPPPSPLFFWVPMVLVGIILVFFVVKFSVRKRPPEAKKDTSKAATELPPAVVFEVSRGRGPLEVAVRDALTGQLVAGAIVARLSISAPTPTEACPTPSEAGVLTDANGTASLDAAGDRIWACAAGYAPTWRPIPVQASKAVIHLLPVRARIQTLYAQLLTDAGRPKLAWGRETPAEAGIPLTLRGASAAEMAELTRQVEVACFGPETPGLAQLEQIAALAARARAGLLS